MPHRSRKVTLAAAFMLFGGVANAESPQPAPVPAGVDQVTVFRAGEGPYNNYRIPAVIRTKRGTVLAFCEGRQTPRGPGNDTGEINLILRRSTDGGRTFGPLQVVWADGKNTCGNPCPVVDETTGTIWLLMTHNLGHEHEREINARTSAGSRTVWVTSSTDDGATWSPPREITKQVKKPDWGWYATGPGVGIQIRQGPYAGRLVIPCDYSYQPGPVRIGNSFVIFSDDHGQTWQIGGEAPELGFNECQVVELAGGRLMLNMRNLVTKDRADTPRHRGVCVSDDGGATFSHLVRDPALPEPICQASILRYSWPEDGRSRILFSNPASTKDRLHMTVRLSYDEGSTWPVSKELYAGRTGYSSLVAFPDGKVGLFYEAGDGRTYERIDFATFDLSWLTEGSEPAAAKPDAAP
jgi:sialidase-1